MVVLRPSNLANKVDPLDVSMISVAKMSRLLTFHTPRESDNYSTQGTSGETSVGTVSSRLARGRQREQVGPL